MDVQAVAYELCDHVFAFGGRADEIGAIAPGLFADFLICDQELNLQNVYLGGEKL